MLNTPTTEQIASAKTWTELYKLVGLNPRNDRAAKKVKEYVREIGGCEHIDRRQQYKFDDARFAQVVSESISIRDALKKLGLNAVGAAYLVFHRRVDRLGLDTSHFLGQAARKGAIGVRRDIQEYLVVDGPVIQSFKLKLKLYQAGLKTEQCEKCHITEWMGKPAPLQLDHENGNNADNRIENLRILCANCHALTPTYCGKNIGAHDRT